VKKNLTASDLEDERFGNSGFKTAEKSNSSPSPNKFGNSGYKTFS